MEATNKSETTYISLNETQHKDMFKVKHKVECILGRNEFTYMLKCFAEIRPT